MTRLILVTLSLVFAAQPAFSQEGQWDDWGPRRGDGVHLRILRDYHLAAGSTASDPVIVIGGTANIEGRAESEIMVIGGTLRVGPSAVIRGDLITVGGEAIIDPAADVAGDVAETIVIWPDLGFTWAQLGEGWWAAAAFVAMLVRLGVVLVAALFIAVVGPRWVRSIGARAGASVAVAGALGLAGELLFLPGLALIVVALLISIIGIPLLGAVPFLLGAAAVIWVAGFAGVVARVGSRLRGSDADYNTAPVMDLLVGFAAITAVTVVAHLMALGPGWMRPFAISLGAVGLIIEYLTWTIGLGAAIAAFSGRRRSSPPPPVPVPVPA